LSRRLANGILVGVLLIVAQVQPPPALIRMLSRPGHLLNRVVELGSIRSSDAWTDSASTRREGKVELSPGFLFEPQTTSPTPTSDINRQRYVGDGACRACHSEKVESYFHTAHHLTSRLPTQESILGSFVKRKNVLKTSNAAIYFRMDSKADGFYQSSISAVPPFTPPRSERIDVVIGSGRVGQSYLYWKNDRLFQLPVSYWVDLNAWVNSPGYRDGTANFERPVVPRCLECHVTYAESVASPEPGNRYKPTSVELGISCERCHGPGQEHVEAMTAGKPSGSFVNLAKLTRERQIEVCAQCHGGRRIPLTPAFSFVPGEPLDEFFRRDTSTASATADVHGNQVALLQMSRCYQSSADFACSVCHDVHQPQRDTIAFSNRCLKCHQPESCGEFSGSKQKIMGSCVDCHMPVQPSNLIISNSNGKHTRAMVRTHWIKIYPELRTP
jgi:hypothetical protein